MRMGIRSSLNKFSDIDLFADLVSIEDHLPTHVGAWK